MTLKTLRKQIFKNQYTKTHLKFSNYNNGTCKEFLFTKSLKGNMLKLLYEDTVMH